MLAAIGRVAAEAAVVDDHLRELFCFLIDSPYGRIITAGEETSNICIMCLRVARYNTSLTDHDIETLAAIVRAIESFRPHRNFLIHARWEKASAPGEHIGVRSSRPSPRADAKGTDEIFISTPREANWVADQYHIIGEHIETFIDNRFDRPTLPYLSERTAWKRFNEIFAPILQSLTETGPREGERPPGAAPSAAPNVP